MRPMQLSDGEKLILIMLSEIHQKLGIENGVDSKLVQSAIFSGNLWALNSEFSGIFHGSEPTPELVTETLDILDMWRFVERSYESLSNSDKTQVEKEAPLGKYVQFTGFDGNTEAEYSCAARFLIDELHRFEEFKGRELNSHMPSIGPHRRMLAVFLPMRNSLGSSDLTATQIIEILRQRVHPEARKAASN